MTPIANSIKTNWLPQRTTQVLGTFCKKNAWIPFCFLALVSCVQEKTSRVKPFEGEFSSTIGREAFKIVATSDSTLSVTDNRDQQVDFELMDGSIYISGGLAEVRGDSLLLTYYGSGGEHTAVFLRVQHNDTGINQTNNHSDGNEDDERMAEEEEDNNTITIQNANLYLLDASLKKVKTVLGPPDKANYLYVDASGGKIAAVYLNRVIDKDKSIKHLVLFINNRNSPQATVREVHAVDDNQRVHYGIHYVVIQNGKISSNSSVF